MATTLDLLLELVGVQSDTGTTMELAMAAKLHALIREHPYFAQHPDHCGTFEQGDLLKRPVVWGLRKGSGRRTVILAGHFDAVEIEPYGWLKPYALAPAELKRKMLESGGWDEDMARDLRDDNWGFGRGMADMKAGLAILLQALFEHRNPAVNLLFMGVPDEENMSSGALQSIPLLHQLRQRFGLDYSLLILGEPQCHNVENCRDVQLVGGSTGKMLPVVLTKGILTHAADILKGINSAFMLAEIVRRVELNPDLAAEHLGCFAQPPTVQIMRDQKTTYDVSVPEFSAACFNFMFLRNRTPMSLVEALGDLCRQAMEAVVARYQAAFDHMAAGGGIAERARLRFTPEVLTLSQLEGRLREQGGDFAAFRKEITGQLGERIRSGQCNLPGASVLYMKALVERSRITGPVVLIGISPPYYPSVNTAAIGKDIAPILAGLDGYMRAKYGSGVVDVPYCAGMTDMSYTSCLDPGTERRFLDNLALPTDLYDVPVEGIGELNIPALIIGPQGKDIHKRGERVYLPDVTGRIPDLIGRIIEQA